MLSTSQYVRSMLGDAIDYDRAERIAAQIESSKAATLDDLAEAAYLRGDYGWDCRPRGPIGPDAADRYLDCAQLRADRAVARALPENYA